MRFSCRSYIFISLFTKDVTAEKSLYCGVWVSEVTFNIRNTYSIQEVNRYKIF